MDGKERRIIIRSIARARGVSFAEADQIFRKRQSKLNKWGRKTSERARLSKKRLKRENAHFEELKKKVETYEPDECDLADLQHRNMDQA